MANRICELRQAALLKILASEMTMTISPKTSTPVHKDSAVDEENTSVEHGNNEDSNAEETAEDKDVSD